MASHAHVPGCARLNVMRLNAARLDYYEPLQFVQIGGSNRSANTRIEGAAVQHVLNDAPDTAHVTVHGFVPVAGWTLAIYSGDWTVDHQLFGGRILETTVRYEQKPQNVCYDLQGIDPTWLLNRRRVLWKYTGWSATDIVLHLVTFASGVTTKSVALSLPVIDEITFTNETVATCLTAVCERIGGYWYLDYAADLHVFLTEATTANPITDTQAHGSSDHQLTEDLSQVVTRVIGRGAAAGAAIDLPAGATELPIDLGDQQNFYNVAGGLAEVGARRITYTGVRGLGATGALVGVGNSPTSGPSIVQLGGASALTVGAAYKYAVTFVTAQGETIPGPVVTGTPSGGTPPAPTTCQMRRSNSPHGGAPGPTIGGVYHFYTLIPYDGGSYSWNGPLGGPFTYDGYLWELFCGNTVLSPQGFTYLDAFGGPPPARYRQVWIYRTLANAATYYACGFVDVPTSPVSNYPAWKLLTYNPPDGDIAYPHNLPPAGGPIFSNLQLTQIPIAGTTTPAVTQRKVYRTMTNGAQLKLLTTLANNTDTVFNDTTGDNVLGANAPTGDTSGLTDNRQVVAGATELPVSATGPFESDGGTGGGWARVGNLVVRYTGLGTGTLIGLPATGPGALSATVRYGTQVLVQPRLVGVATLDRTVRKGEPITIRLEVEDLAAQDALAQRLGSMVRADGVVEEVFSDSRMTLAELRDYLEALLADRKDPRRTLRFYSRDPSLQVGRLVTVTLITPPISGTFRIQRITFSEIAITGGLARVLPKRQVEASNKLFTFADLLRRLRGREGGAQ